MYPSSNPHLSYIQQIEDRFSIEKRGDENPDLEFEETAIDKAPDNNDVDGTKIPRGKSIAHHILVNKAVCFDIETGGENVVSSKFYMNVSKF